MRSPPTILHYQPPNASLTLLTAHLLSTYSNVGCLPHPHSPLSAPIACQCSLALFHKGTLRLSGAICRDDRKRRWEGGSELALERETWIGRVWSHSIAGDTLPISLREPRYVSTPTILKALREFGSDRCVHDHHPDGQCPSRSQSSVLVIIY